MLALPTAPPCLFSPTPQWPLHGSSDSFLDSPAYRDFSPTSSSDPKTTKKLYHNASERDRRKKMNHLYSSIRSMLPHKYHTKKMSIPSTISHVLKYIPELQGEVEKLIRKKEDLLLRISKQEVHETPREKLGTIGRNSSTVSASRLSNGEVSIQMCMNISSNAKDSVSDMLLNLEQEELLLLNASWFQSSGGTTFCNFHRKAVKGRCRLDCKLLSEKIEVKMHHAKEIDLENDNDLLFSS